MARVGSLFAGVGCTDLGLQWAGHETAWAAEQDPYRQRILAKRYGCPVLEDVHLVDGSEGKVEIITGGFPCQDVSPAGRGAGITGSRSTLYTELIRAIGLHRPKVVLIENVTLLTKRGLERLLVDLAAIGYAAEWDCIPAMALGAPHIRDRIWILAYPADQAPEESLVFGPIASWHVLAQLKYPPGQWPRAGMIRDGLAYELHPSAPVPLVRARFAHGLPAFPTPTARDGKGATPEGVHEGGFDLATYVDVFPTPSAQEAGTDPHAEWVVDKDGNPPQGWNERWYHAETGRIIQRGLTQAIRMFPTPRQSDADRGGRGDLLAVAKDRPMAHGAGRAWPTPKASPSGPDFAREGRDESGGDDLATAVARFPTPRSSGRCNAGGSNSRKAARDRGTYVSGSLNPDWVEWLMGLPIGHTDIDRDEPGPVEPWPHEPPGTPRVTVDTPNRTARNAALGDGLVPQIPALIMSQLPEEILK